MKKFLLATVSMVALTSVTRAADMPAAIPTKARMYSTVPVVTWDGAYIGIQGGIASNKTSFNDDGFFSDGNSATHLDDQKAGGTIGGLLGYNLQQGPFVYGVEGDWSWIGAKANRVVPQFNFDLNTLSTSFDVNWIATLRGRVGVAFDTTLIYFTGGVAFAHANNSVELIDTLDNGFGVTFAQNQTRVGWTAGAGAEYMFSQHWTARAEFRYVDLGKTTVTCNSATNFNGCLTLGPSGAYRGEFSNRLMLGLLGVAYKFQRLPLHAVIAGLDPAIHGEFAQSKSVKPFIAATHHGCAGQARA